MTCLVLFIRSFIHSLLSFVGHCSIAITLYLMDLRVLFPVISYFLFCQYSADVIYLSSILLPRSFPHKNTFLWSHLSSFLDHHHFRPHHIILSPLLYVYVGYTDTSLRYPYTLLIIIPSYFHFLSLPLCSSLSLWVYAVVDHSFDHIISAICHVLTCALLLYNLL